MSRWRFRRVRTKIIVSFCLLMTAGGVVSTLLVRQTVSSRVEAGAERAARGLADMLAVQVADALAYGDQLAVRSALQHAERANPDVVFAAVSNERGEPVAHSFPLGRFPADLLPLIRDARPGITAFESDRGPIIQVTAPISSGLLGHLHLGVSTRWVGATVAEAVGNVLTITLAALAIGILGIFVLAGLITRPLSVLRAEVERFGRAGTPIRSDVGADDEVHDLARSFEQMSQQITERVAETKALHDYVEQVLDAMPLAITVVAPDGRIEYVNRRAGDARGAIVGRPYAEVFGAERPPLPATCDAGAELQHETPDRRTLGVNRVCLAGDGARRTLEIARDLTHERQLASQLQRAERLAAAGEVAAGVVHTINNPLDGVRRALEIAATRPEDVPRVTTMLELAREGVDRIATVTRSMLAFARPRLQGNMQPTAIAPLVEAAAKLVELKASGAAVAIVCALDPAVGTRLVDAHAVSEVVVNLLLNAIDACAARPSGDAVARRIEVAALVGPGQGFTLRVGDTGVGIAPAHLPHVFEPFFTTKEIGRGTGLGLSVARRVAEAHGGELSVASQLGHGTTFTMWLPSPAAESP